MARKILIFGASYGALLGAKLALAGHGVTLVCTARTEAKVSGFDDFLLKPVEPADLLMALGKPVAELVRRSVDMRLEQLRRQVELGDSLLRHGLARPESLPNICVFLERAFHACRESIEEIPATPAEREAILRDIDRIEARILRTRSRH